MLNSYIFFENGGPDTEEKARLQLSLTGRLPINNIRYQCVQREGVAVTATTTELVSYQAQEDSDEKHQNKTHTKSLERNQGLEILLLTGFFVRFNLSHPKLFLGWQFSHKHISQHFEHPLLPPPSSSALCILTAEQPPPLLYSFHFL